MGMGTYNGRAMLSAFGQECGGQRMMRGEQLWRTDKVIDKSTAVTAHGFTISAKVLSQDYRPGAPGGAYTTSLRFVPMSVAETNVAHGLVVKAELWPRAVAHYHSVGFLAGVGTNHAIAQNLIESVTNVAIIPTAWTQAATASCTCGDFGPGAWCKHVAALGYELISRCEVDAFYPFKLRCFELSPMLPQVSRKRERPETVEVICLDSDEDEDREGSAAKPLVV